MPEIRLTYWWNGHEPGDVVEVDEVTARTLLSAIAEPISTDEPVRTEKQRPSRKTAEQSGD